MTCYMLYGIRYTVYISVVFYLYCNIKDFVNRTKFRVLVFLKSANLYCTVSKSHIIQAQHSTVQYSTV